MKYRIADITEPVILNAAVAKARGLRAFPSSKDFADRIDPAEFAYAYDFSKWKDAGPIIEAERIPNDGDVMAAMRTYLTRKFGEFVEIDSYAETSRSRIHLPDHTRNR